MFSCTSCLRIIHKSKFEFKFGFKSKNKSEISSGNASPKEMWYVEEKINAVIAQQSRIYLYICTETEKDHTRVDKSIFLSKLSKFFPKPREEMHHEPKF